MKYFNQFDDVRAIPVEATKRQTVGQIPNLCRKLAPTRGVPGKTLRAMIIGIPNVGKSTLINTLAGKKIARVGDKPAITTCHQQIDLRNGIHLNDTPGLLWPDIRNQQSAYRLAVSGAIGENAMDYVTVAIYAAQFLANRYPEQLKKRYKLDSLPEEATDTVETIGRKRGCLVSGGEVDHERASELLLRELRAGHLGPLSLETPDDFQEEDSDDS